MAWQNLGRLWYVSNICLSGDHTGGFVGPVVCFYNSFLEGRAYSIILCTGKSLTCAQYLVFQNIDVLMMLALITAHNYLCPRYSQEPFILMLYPCTRSQANRLYPEQPMIPTYVFGWPTGKETGDFLAVDLGMSNLKLSRPSYSITDRQALSLCTLLR